MSDSKTYQENLKGLVSQLGEMLPAEQFEVFSQDAERLGKDYPEPLKANIGDQAVDFTLPNANGNIVKLQEQLEKGPVLLSFYRGTWCPYCNLQLKMYQDILTQIKEAGASLIAISPMTPDNSLDMQQKNELEFEVLSDEGNTVARNYTTVFTYSDASTQAMKDLGYDFHSFYADESGELPVPATFIIGIDGKIVFAATEGGDYRERVEPQEILNALKVQA